MNDRCQVIAFSGASGSGKSTLAAALVDACNALAPNDAQLVPLDSYYRDLSHLSFAERDSTNFDHPDAIESDRFSADLEALKSGKGVYIPVYDFTQHSPTQERIWVEASPRLITEGVLLPAWPTLRKLVDLWVHVDTPLELCLARRIERDGKSRGRSEASVRQFWSERAEPMYHAWGARGQDMSDLVVRGDVDIASALALVLEALGE